MNIDAIAFTTTEVPNAGAGEYYDTVIYFATAGNAALPDTFNVLQGELPAGMSLVADRTTLPNGQMDPAGALTGNARLIGYPRIERKDLPYNFVVKAISTGKLAQKPQPPGTPALAAEQPFAIEVLQGRINILNPTFQEGSNDPAVPAFPDVINFVNPLNPQAFFSFPFEAAGGSGNNVMVVYLPRELELSVFDTLVSKNPDGSSKLDEDTDEAAETNDSFKVYFGDGGIFNLQAGTKKVQIGGFQSPRGPIGSVGKIDGLLDMWFQRPFPLGPPISSRRDINDVDGLGLKDLTLGTRDGIAFSDYFSSLYEGTNQGWTGPAGSGLTRRKYPFVASEYSNAFLPKPDGLVHPTELRFNIIVEAIDTRGTPSRNDDFISRKAYIVQVKVPDIAVDSVRIDGGTAGVDYNVVMGVSGGVPPLQFELEWVDGVDDADYTVQDATHTLDQKLLGIEIDKDKGNFFGVPRADGHVDLTVRVYAAVMGTAQRPADPTEYTETPTVDPQGRHNERNGWHPETGLPGVHKTFGVTMAAPPPLALKTGSLDPGVDGFNYKASDGSGTVKLEGTGGVPLLDPYPVGYRTNTYPATLTNPKRNYEWTATYDQDNSYLGTKLGGSYIPDPNSKPKKGVSGLPSALNLQGGIDSPQNGEITGTAFDRGFHPVYIIQRDRYVGNAQNSPSESKFQEVPTPMGLSISPDNAIYLRGLGAKEGAGNGTPSGLLDAAAAMAEPRMVPMFLQAQLFRATTGQQTPDILKGLPPKADILPVGIPNGGSRLNLDKSEATIQGFWPPEAGKEVDWYYYGNRAWTNLQQEMTWIQIPDKEQHRVFMWGETEITKWNSGSADGVGMYGKRYQIHDKNGERGILMLEPRTGNFWVPARFSNERGGTDGAWFGSEFVQPPIQQGYYQPKAPYRGSYYYTEVDYADMEHHGQGGLGVYIENLSTSANTSAGWYAADMGRGGVSVAVSDDGLWCATAMPGGESQKICIWRTDGRAIDNDSNIFGAGNVNGIDGTDANGKPLTNSAGVIELGGQSTNADDILPDSLKFVEGGLIFSRYTRSSPTDYVMNRIFGFSLKSGALTEIDINSRGSVSGVSLPPFSLNTKECRYVPDQDQIRGLSTSQVCLSQWSWAGKDTDFDDQNANGRRDLGEDSETGPNAIAFTGGQMYDVERNDYDKTGRIGREGFRVEANRNQSLFFMEFDGKGADGLDLSTAKITDLTGNGSAIYGDLLTPGRPGEMLDFVKVSGDGKYVAIVRDWSIADASSFSFYNPRPTFSNYYYYGPSLETASPSHDLLLLSTPIKHNDGSTNAADLDAGKTGNQHVLFVGQLSNKTNGGSGPTGSMPAYASANNLLNAPLRRIHGLDFSEDNQSLFFEYAAETTYSTNHHGYFYGWNVNPSGLSTAWQYSVGTAMVAQFNFRGANDSQVTFEGGTTSALISNPLKTLKSVGGVGPTSGKFGTTYNTSTQNFWGRFRSPNGAFLYYVSDRLDGSAHMFGINMTAKDIVSATAAATVRKPYEAFSTHAAGVKFDQFEANSHNYESRFAASPAGTFLGSGVNMRDGDGIVFVIGSDATSKGAPETDLEIYVFDANRGGELLVLTSDVTKAGTVNAINNLYVSMDGNVVVGQRASSSSSRDDRTALTAQTDLFAVSNVHEVLRTFGVASPNAFVISAKASHGSTVALVGEGTATGAAAIIYSAASGSGNSSWDDRQLFTSVLGENAARSTLDGTLSHYVILSGGRKLDDDPNAKD